MSGFTSEIRTNAMVVLLPLDFRYRVLIHPNGTEAAGIAKLYEAWAK